MSASSSITPLSLPGQAHVKLQLCGRTLLTVAGDSVELPQRLAMLLALVALSGSVERARVAAWLYPTIEASAARRNLRQLLHHHRKLLAYVAEVEGAQMRLLPGVELDVINTDLRAGGVAQVNVESTLAPLLDTVPLEEHTEFSAWLQEQRELQQQYQLDRLGVLASEYERQGRLGEALQLARRIRDADPSSERAHRRVMRLHYLRGDRAAALATFDRCEQYLKHELGVRPAPETLELLHVIEAAERVDSAAPGQRLVPVSLQRPPLTIGRSQELAALVQAWMQGGAFLLLGEAGIGKSRLLADLLVQRPHSVQVRARHGDARRPYATLARLAQALPQRTLLPSEQRQVMHWLLGEDSQTRTAVLNAQVIYEAMQAALRTTELDLVLDDLHLADPASLEMLARLSSEGRGAAQRWGFAARPHETQGLVHLRSTLADAGMLHVVQMHALGTDQVRDFVHSLRLPLPVPSDLPATLARRTGGNPMFMLEMLKGWCQTDTPVPLHQLGVPETVAQLVDQQIAACSPRSASLARLAALAASDFSVELCESVLGESALALSDAWRELEERQLMRAGQFVHDLIQEAAARSVPQAIAQSIHARIATHLQEHAGQPSSIASHWLAAQRDAQACAPLVDAAHQAIRAGRTLEAGQFYEQAAAILQRMGRNDEAFARYFDACEMYADAASSAAFDAVAARAVPLAQTPQERVRARLMLAFGCYLRGELQAAGQRFQDLLDDAIATGEQRSEAECRFEIARVWVQQGRLRDALQMVAAAQNLFRELGLKAREFVARNHVAHLVMRTGLVTAREKLSFEELLQMSRMEPLGLERRSYHLSHHVAPARIAANRGDATHAAELLLQGADQLLRPALSPDMRYHWIAVSLETCNDIGRFDLALELLRRHDERGDSYRGAWWQALAVERVALYESLGRHDLAQHHLAEFKAAEVYSHYVRQRLLLLLEPGAAAYRPEEEHLGLRIRGALAALARQPKPRLADWLSLIQTAEAAEFTGWLPALQAQAAWCAAQAGKVKDARSLAQQALDGLALRALPTTRVQVALALHKTFTALRQGAAAQALVGDCQRWLMHEAVQRVPAPFRESFLLRQHEHQELARLVAEPAP